MARPHASSGRPARTRRWLKSRLTFHDERRFDEEGTILFSLGDSLRIRGRGRLAPCADPELRHGSVVWLIAGGDGHFDRSSGLITSNFLLSATGDLTENQLAVVFAPRRSAARAY
ncbi:MAG TPA: hypothetical protein VKA57_05555 [Solirubrobacteraceae bacterium]|nr:hypothetical protein [Solirubrobacteraceae bacterium]